MKARAKKWLKPILFIAVGALAGFMYYRFIGCKSGVCPIVSNLYASMAYMGFMGWLLSGTV